MPQAPAKPWYADWTQYVCPGPTRRFTPEEMARGGQQPWPKGLDQYLLISALLYGLVGLVFDWSARVWLLGAASLALSMGALLWASRQLWHSPTRRRYNLSAQVFALFIVLQLLAVDQWGGLERLQRQGFAFTCVMLLGAVLTAWWFLVVFRVQQIESRLRELDDRAAQQRLQRRLATAQIHPHFVFNTLASLTHWVESGDPRAAPLLRDFSAYLRATLPMFEREQQPLAEELELVRRYLAIMQARLGDRLQWQLHADPAADALSLPPGSLLTLVENAVTHGIEPSLRGGAIEVRVEPGRIAVRNGGEDLDPAAPEGLGLSNTRERLAAQGAGLQLRALHPGCEAVITFPTSP